MAKNDNAALNEVLKRQQQLDDLERKENELTLALAKLDEILSGVAPSEATLNGLQRNLEDIMADIAMGMDRDAEKDQVILAIADEQERLDVIRGTATGAAGSAKATQAGLERKLKDLAEIRQTLRREHFAYLNSYLTAEAERLGAVYLEHAKALAGVHRQLLGLNQIIVRRNHVELFQAHLGAALRIPLFRLAAHRDQGHLHNSDELGEAVGNNRGETLEYAMATEHERLTAAGLSFYP